MLLIEAYNVTSGGGVVLLNELKNHLDTNEIMYKIIRKKKVTYNDSDDFLDVDYSFNRYATITKIIKKHNVSVVLYFGNYPPTFKLDIPVVLFFQNALLLKGMYQNVFSLKSQLVFKLKQLYIKMFLRNIDSVIVQTDYIKKEFTRTFNYGRTVKVAPFYNIKIKKKLLNANKVKNTFIYVSSSVPHKNHIFLFKVWMNLFKEGYTPKLYITIKENSKLLDELDSLQKNGVRIVNIGQLGHYEILRHTANSEYCIFPSLVETIGLGMVEAHLLKCKVLATNLDYTKEIINPDYIFDPFDEKETTQIIIEALKENREPDSNLQINFSIFQFVNLILNANKYE